MQKISPSKSDYKWRNRQFEVTRDGDVRGRADAGCGRWLIYSTELTNPRLLQFARLDPDVDEFLFFEALHKALSIRLGHLEKRARIKDS